MQPLEEIPSAELNLLFGHFAMKVKRKNGSEYEPNSISFFFRSFDRYMKDKGQSRSIMFDKEFAKARSVLEAKRKSLRNQGMGKKERADEPITEKEEDLLWETKQLGDDTLYSLPQTVWYFNTMHFGWMGCDEHRHICLGDFVVKSDSAGNFVEFNTERGTKTRRGVKWQKNRPFNPRMYATGDDINK